MRKFLLLVAGLIFLIPVYGIPQTDSRPAPSNSHSALSSEGSLPEFHVYKMGLIEGLAVVVSPTVSDEQLKNLLWFFRKNVRQGRFREVGITKPTTKRYGKLDYSDGMISVYRGSKCANELFLSQVGPCGYGDHAAASYQWGIEGDPSKDSGFLLDKNGDFVPVFDYKDNWKP